VSDTDFFFEEEIDIQQTSQETPPPPPPPAVQEVEVLNVVEDDVEVEEIEINTEDDKDVEVVIAPPVEAPVEEEEEDVIFQVVESMPEFPGGQQALFKYLAENVKYPVIAQENGIQGRVICQFVVNKDGSIVDVVAVRSSGEASLDKEAIRVIKSMPKWKPGKQRGKPVRVKYTVPVNFRLQ
jgi:protein TonB